MGVMLALDQTAAARSRRRGQHVRNTDSLASTQNSAGVLRRDAPAGAGRYLSRLAMTVLAARRRPVSLAGPPAQARTRKRRARRVDLALTVSVPCLLGQCHVTGDGPGCRSGGCTHHCHRR